MTNIDEQFIKDLEECLKVADELSELDTVESKLFVSKQLQDLHNFLQQKQQHAEARIDEEIKKEENEIDKLKDRIQRTKNSDGANESDIAYTELGLLWSVLKDEFWKLAFNAFILETEDSVKVILETLLAVLQASFRHCKERAAEHRTGMMFQAYFPGENAQQNKNLKFPKEIDKNLEGLCKTCQKKSTPFCISSIQKVVMANVREDKAVAKYFKTKSKLLQNTMEKYLEKCVEFCWIACFEEPEIRLIITPQKECKKISHEFIGLDRTTYKARQDAAFVEWPAVVQGDKILMPWHLYPARQQRPDAKDLRGDPSKDYRVTGLEINDGTLINETEEDKSTEMKYQTPPEANGGDSKHDISKIENKHQATNKATSNDTIYANKSASSKQEEAKKQVKNDKKQGYKLARKTKADKPNLDF